jgi:hypothetical protein
LRLCVKIKLMKFLGSFGIVFYFLVLFLINKFVNFEIAVLIGLAFIFYALLHLIEKS